MKTKPRPARRAQPRMLRTGGTRRTPVHQIPRKWRWHCRVLETLHDLLIDDRTAKLAAASEPIEPHSMDPADSATDEYDRALALSLLSAEQDALHEVDAAIHRIITGTYGICERTGERISMQRLRATPWTRFSKHAQEAMEKEGQFRAVRLANSRSIERPGIGGLAEAEEPEREELQVRVLGRRTIADSLKAREEGRITGSAPKRALRPGRSLAGTIGHEAARRPARGATPRRSAREPATGRREQAGPS